MLFVRSWLRQLGTSGPSLLLLHIQHSFQSISQMGTDVSVKYCCMALHVVHTPNIAVHCVSDALQLPLQV